MLTPVCHTHMHPTHMSQVVGKGGFGKVNAITKLDTNELLALKRIEKYAVLQSQSHLNMVGICACSIVGAG